MTTSIKYRFRNQTPLKGLYQFRHSWNRRFACARAQRLCSLLLFLLLLLLVLKQKLLMLLPSLEACLLVRRQLRL